MTRKDVAIIGGTFDPIHIGHVDMIKYLSDNYIVDEVWVLPSYNSPHKDIDTKKSFEHRVNMIKLAIDNIKNVSINAFEKDFFETHNTKTYTYDVLNELKKKYLNCRFHFVVGFDSIKSIHTWHDYKNLLNDYWFYIFDRKDDEFSNHNLKVTYLDNLGKNLNIKFIYELFDVNITDVSSTYIRELLKDRIANKELLLEYIDKKVYNYIVENKLYE